jgi:hypothetical protein
MGEAKNRQEEIAAMKAAQEAQAKAEAEFRKLIDTPYGSRAEVDKALADNDVQTAQLRVLRLRKVDELNQIDHQLEMAALDRSIIVRRALNETKPAEAPKGQFGKPVGPGDSK